MVCARMGDKTAEMVISFAESKGIVYVNGKQVNAVRLTDSPAKTLDQILTDGK